MAVIKALLLLLTFAMFGLGQSADASFTASLAAHGGAAVRSVQTIQVIGTSTANGQSQHLVVSASMDGRVRLDFGTPVERSLTTTEQGRVDIRGSEVIKKPSHVGLFASLDMLSILGLRRFVDSAVERTLLGSGTIAGRATVRAKAVTASEKTIYGRKLVDDVEVDFDDATGLVAAIRRVQYAEQSLDRPYWLAYEFSDYRNVDGVVFPFRIESSIDGRKLTSFSVTSVVVNPALSPTLWEIQ